MSRPMGSGFCSTVRTRLRAISCWSRISANVACRGSKMWTTPSSSSELFVQALTGRSGLQDGRERAGEPGHHVLAIEGAVPRNDRFAAVVAVDPRQPPLRIDDPDEPRSGGEPVGDLGENLAGAVTGRQHFDDEVGGEIGEANRDGIGESLAPYECNVGSTDGIGAARQREASLGR